jgi:protein-S-isoprenylcysteine O-methyltransferase Ste14
MLLWSQSAMGESLRIGVDPTERTALVTSGPFRLLRNPIYSATFAYVIATAMLVPNPAGIVAAVALMVGLELQVRWVEEPCLLAVHGSAYRAYAARVGRFLPRIGRIAGPAER